ncbi:Bifunctional protein HldE [Bienertia sinuspersici]
MLVNFNDRFAFTCNGCRDLGYGSCYTCHPQCNYHLHKDCYMHQSTISHPFFTQGHFVLDQNGPPQKDGPTQNLLCEACGISIRGWRYAFAIKGCYEISLHPCCMNLPHSHNKLESHNLSCAHCRQGKGVEGWAYVLGNSNVAFHVKCIKEMHHQIWERNYYSPYYSNNNFQYVHQQQGLNQDRFKERPLIFGAANLALNLLGLGGTAEMILIMGELASNIWGRNKK